VSCPAHGAGTVGPPCATTVLTGSMPTARITDPVLCPGAPGFVIGGTVETLIEYLGATRLTENAAHGGTIALGYPIVLIGKVLSLRVIIVAGSPWDTPAGRDRIRQQLEDSERNLGIRIVTGPIETSTDPTLASLPEGPWNGTNNYSPQQVAAINTYGGVIFSPNTVPSTTSHELGHMLSGQTGANNHSTNPNDLMFGSSNRTGTQFGEPWSSATESNPVLR
jgi:uncharacterized Zn-binding protein involved in type VI secretion